MRHLYAYNYSSRNTIYHVCYRYITKIRTQLCTYGQFVGHISNLQPNKKSHSYITKITKPYYDQHITTCTYDKNQTNCMTPTQPHVHMTTTKPTQYCLPTSYDPHITTHTYDNNQTNSALYAHAYNQSSHQSCSLYNSTMTKHATQHVCIRTNNMTNCL